MLIVKFFAPNDEHQPYETVQFLVFSILAVFIMFVCQYSNNMMIIVSRLFRIVRFRTNSTNYYYERIPHSILSIDSINPVNRIHTHTQSNVTFE